MTEPGDTTVGGAGPGSFPAPARPARKPLPRKPKGLGVLITSLAAFLVVIAILAWRMSIGEDPSLGVGPQLAAGPGKLKGAVTKRRIVKLRVVHDPAPQPVAGAVVDSGAVDSSVPAAPTVPAPAAAPTPAPTAPTAPPVTSSS